MNKVGTLQALQLSEYGDPNMSAILIQVTVNAAPADIDVAGVINDLAKMVETGIAQETRTPIQRMFKQVSQNV